MKRAILLFLLLAACITWWIMRGQHTQLATTGGGSTSAAPYPANFEQRLERITGIRLSSNAPLPANIPWQTAEQHPAAGDPQALKGGVVRLPNAGPFPANFLAFGNTTAQFFHQNLKAATDIPLIAKHPLSGLITAGVAEAWAKAGDTWYFRLNPQARYTNGRPVRAGDYLLAVLLQAEQKCAEYTALKEFVSCMRTHDDSVLSLTLRKETDIAELCALLHAAEPDFYRDFGSRFRETYPQRIPPGTGAYRVSQVVKGRMLQLSRIPGWWGEKIPLCRHRFNADTLEYHFLTGEAQVWEFFQRGKLDLIQTRNMAFWQEKTTQFPDIPTLVYDAEYPLPPYGIALNTRTLPDADLRRGLLQAMDMDSAVQQMMRGEGCRLTTFSSGYGSLTPTETPQYHFSPTDARTSFAKAGYTQQGTDGILRNAQGKRLSIRLLYTPHEKISAMVTCLIQSAATCGAEIVPEAVPWQVCHRQLQERSHQMVFWAMPAPATPNPALFLALDAEPGASPFALNDAQMNHLLEQFRQNPTSETLAAIDYRVYELGIWLPGWKENRVRILHRPRLVIPPSRRCYDAADAHLFWVQRTP